MAQKPADTLVSLRDRTTEEQRSIASLGGRASGVARRKKREVTEIYGYWLSSQHDIDIDGEKKSLSGAALINYVMGEIIAKKNKESVMMIAEIRKAREGTTYHIDGGAVDADLEATSAEVLKAEFEAELAKRDKILSARKVEALPEDAAPGQVVAYEVESAEGAPAAQPTAQGETQEPTMQETMKGGI